MEGDQGPELPDVVEDDLVEEEGREGVHLWVLGVVVLLSDHYYLSPQWGPCITWAPLSVL